MSQTLLIHGCLDNHNRADRIAIAIASSAVFRFSKKVLILQMTNEFDCKDTLMGAKLKANTIKQHGISFDDNGIDALIRRMEAKNVTSETFTDCCYSATKLANSFDIANPTRRPDFSDVITKNEDLILELITKAKEIYDLVIILASGKETESLHKLSKMTDKELTVIEQGNKASYESRVDSLFVVNNYDSASFFTYKKMKQIYSIKDDLKLYPVPYNIRFKDSCRTENAIEFLTSNISPDQTDDNYIFAEDLKRLTSAVLSLEEPVIIERKFTRKEIIRR